MCLMFSFISFNLLQENLGITKFTLNFSRIKNDSLSARKNFHLIIRHRLFNEEHRVKNKMNCKIVHVNIFKLNKNLERPLLCITLYHFIQLDFLITFKCGNQKLFGYYKKKITILSLSKEINII